MIRVPKRIIAATPTFRWLQEPGGDGTGIAEISVKATGPVRYAVRKLAAEPSVAMAAFRFVNLANGQEYQIRRTREGWWECSCAASTFGHDRLAGGCKHCQAAAGLQWPAAALRVLEFPEDVF